MKFPQTKIYFSIFIIIAAGFSIPVGAVFVPNFNIDLLNLNEFGDLDSGFTGSDAASSYLIPNKLRLKETWQLLNEQTVPLSPIKIGIIDNRIDISHPEFGGVNFGNTPPIAKSLPPSSPSSHGMAVAGIIGSNNVSSSSPTNYIPPHMNGILSGANKLKYTLELRSPDLELFGVRVTEIGTAFGFRQAINKLDKENVNIINVSEGFGAFGGRMALIRRKLERLSNILFVVGSGNDGKDANDISPANLGDDLENVITVGFVDNSDQRSSVNGNSSNFGDAVNLSAPGVNVFTPGFFASPFDLSDYQPFSGTSASAPMVTGVAGLIKAIKPNLSPAEIKQILTESADPITASTTEEIDKKLGSACNDGRPGFRGCRLNAEKAVCHSLVLNCVPPPPPPPCILSGTISSDTTIPSQSVCVVQGTFSVPSGRTFTIEPGVVMKFESASSGLFIDGVLNAQGSTSSPIIFTSFKDDTVGGDTNNDGLTSSPQAGDWHQIFVGHAGSATLSHARVRFGGHFQSFLPQAGLRVQGILNLSNSRLTQNQEVNLMVESDGTANITNSEIDNSTNIGILILPSLSQVGINQSSIHDNISFGVLSSGPAITTAINNWWGSVTGPLHPTLNPGGLGNQVSNFVDFIPFLTSDPVGILP